MGDRLSKIAVLPAKTVQSVVLRRFRGLFKRENGARKVEQKQAPAVLDPKVAGSSPVGHPLT